MVTYAVRRKGTPLRVGLIRAPGMEQLQHRRHDQVSRRLAGDIVDNKKPAPDIYLLALEKTGKEPSRCFVVEDSRNGMLAGHRAGINVAVTTSIYTSGENFDEARLVVSCLGDDDGERGTLIQGSVAGFDGVLTLPMLGSLIG